MMCMPGATKFGLNFSLFRLTMVKGVSERARRASGIAISKRTAIAA